jgi:cation/acetate symporter
MLMMMTTDRGTPAGFPQAARPHGGMPAGGMPAGGMRDDGMRDDGPGQMSGAGPARLGMWLTVLLALAFLVFVCFTAFDPQGLAVSIDGTGLTTIWFAYGLGLIAGSWLLSVIYVIVANRAADRAGTLAGQPGGQPGKTIGGAAARPIATIGLVLAGTALAPPAWAAAGPVEAAATHGSNMTAIGMFLLLLLGTAAITVWAARRNRSAEDFYAAGGHMSGFQNGLAIAGDLISAGAFLGLSGLIYARGFDGLIYAVGYSIGYPVVTLLLADRMRNLGRFTFADVVSYRLQQGPVRAFAATSTLAIVLFYLIAQMVGAGQLIQVLFGLPYAYAELIVGVVMICYVIFGGMTATSWVQIVKAVLMLICGTAIALLVMARFGFRYDRLLAAAVAVHPKHAAILVPTSFSANPLSTLSLALAQFCGSAGLPHLIMRFFTVRDARTARTSMLWGSAFVSYFFALIFIIGFGAVALVGGNAQYLTASGGLIGGGNMAAIHLSQAVGGNLMLGFVSAVAFATIIAVVAGLTLAGASAVSHDLYANVFRKGRADEAREVRISKIATLAIGVLAIGLGIAFRTQNIAYMIALVFGIAASSNFPLLILAIYWRGLTTRGAVAGGLVGLVGSLLLTVLGPSIWVAVLGHAAPIVTLDPPTLVTMPLAVLACVGVSLLDRSRRAAVDRAGFAEQNARALDGTSTGALAAAAGTAD